MHFVDRSVRFVRGFILSYGPSSIKKRFWDQDFSSNKWDFIDNTVGDCVYPFLEKYAAGGSILDLGCGPGNTANELASSAYQSYVGVDISEAALNKARKRTEENGRADKNSFAQGDFLGYVPPQKFDLILFRESMYHVPLGKVRVILDRFTAYLKDGGVFIVRMYTTDHNGNPKSRPNAMLDVIEAGFDVVEKLHEDGTGATVIAFRPRHA